MKIFLISSTIVFWGVLAIIALRRYLIYKSNKKIVSQKVLNKNSLTRYFPFTYEGKIYFEAPSQKSTNRLFKGFKRKQLKFGKLYANARNKKNKHK